jgi:hypothetical protein
MGEIVLGLASSHAFAVMNPEEWDDFRTGNRRGYERRYGTLPPENARIPAESDTIVGTRFAGIRTAFARLRALLDETRPDAMIFVADDQDENFLTTIPQLAVYTGERFRDGRANQEGTERRAHPGLADAILSTCVQNDIEMTCIKAFPDDRLFAHAFGPVLRVVDPQARIPVVPLFVNAIHEPSPSPSRCYRVGQAIREAVTGCPHVGRVAIYASGGLSHFTAGYPWPQYVGPFGHGDIDEEFDRHLLTLLDAGRGSDLARLTSSDLLAHGEIELRSWILALGAIGDVKPELLIYQPIYRALMGIGVAAWIKSTVA